MPVTTPAMGMTAVDGHHRWYRFVRRLATRPAAEISLVYVPDGTHDQLAVMKRLPKALATDSAAVEKFRVEARIASMLEHPAIVRVLEVVETPGEDFYTMEFVRGADMRQLMDALVEQKRTLPLDCVILIAIELCNALDYAHHLTDAKGLPAPLIHRELSPSKVLISIDGTIKLTGFSAPPVARQQRRARTQSIGYTSPERCLGETMDSRSDLFALGVLLYELSSGERLFGDASTEHEVMQKLVRGDMPRPSEVRRGYPRELEMILMKTLARERNDRYQSAAELQIALETFLWSRWPTATTSALAKLVNTTFPSDDTELANGTRELDRIDPFAASGSPSDEPVLWLGPVPFAKPYPRTGEGPRTDTKELKRIAPENFPESSNANVALGVSGPKSKLEDLQRPSTLDRAETVDELAIAVEESPRMASGTSAPARRNANVLPKTPRAKVAVLKTGPVALGTPGVKPAPLPAPVTEPQSAPRGQYQRPRAVDEWPENPDDIIIERLRAKKRVNVPDAQPANDSDIELARPQMYSDDDGVTVARTRTSEQSKVARVALARVITPLGLVRAEMVRAPQPEEPPPATTQPETVIELVKRTNSSIKVNAQSDLDQVSQLNWTLLPSAPAAATSRLPSPRPAEIAGGRRPLPTIVAIVCVVIVGVLASAYAIRSTTHEPSVLPEVTAAQPSPPTDTVLKMTQKAPPPPVVIADVKKPKSRARKDKDREPKQVAVAQPTEAPVDPRKLLFPPPDKLPVSPGSLDGLPSIKTIEVKGTTADTAVRKAVEQALSPLRGCYRGAARAKQQTPQVDLRIAFEFDARRVPLKISAIGGGSLDMLATCAAEVTSDIRGLPAPTNGNVRVSVSLEFRPNP
ncbi:MAG: serine/threonine protein kinase [Myxococcota bacterium]|nr:serine/threonine protein kinase [Myxococcota bacterium]